MSTYGAKFDRLADLWRELENEHDKIHPDRNQCGGVGGCGLMFAAVGLQQDMIEELKGWRKR